MRLGVARSLRSALHWPVVAPACLLMLMGVMFLSGLTIHAVAEWHLRQLEGVALGLAAALVVVLVPYKSLVRRAYLLYGANIVLLLFVLLFSAEDLRGRRWLNVLGFNFQPSELMKLTLVLTLARYVRFRSSYKTFRGLWAPFLLTLVPMALILKQPDLGTALICVPLLFTILFAAGARSRHLLLIVLLGAGGMFPVYKWGLAPYQRARVDGFVAQLPFVSNQLSDEEARKLNNGQNFQSHKSKVAVGSGGIAGVGLGEGEEGALFYVPERHNDFIFSVVAHEWGLLGALALLALYAWLLLAILAVAARHRDPAARLICVGVFALIGFQAFINLAMTVGLMPITGLTLPLLSYGRSSIVVSILALALVCNVAARPSYEFGRGDFD